MTELIINSSVLILVVIALRCLLKGKISLRLQYALWALVLARLLIPVALFESPISVMNAVQSAENMHEEQMSVPVTAAPSALGDPENVPPDVTGEVVPGVITNVSHHVFHWGLLLKWIWYAGIAAVGLCLLVSNIGFFRKLGKTRKKYNTDICALPVYVVEALPSPCLFGLFRPAVYITPDVAGDETKLRHVLAHETTHYRHGDHVWAALRGVCLAVYWFNPLVWAAAALSRRDAELACDEGAILRLGEASRAEYGRTLIGLTCEKHNAMDLLCVATTMTDGKKGIRERITLIAKKPKMLVPALIAVLLAALAAVGCTFTGAKTEDAEIVPLTAGELEQYNKTFEPMLYDEQGNPSVNPLSNFLTSYYDRPEDINLSELLRYFPSEDVTDEAEFEALKATENWPFGADATLDNMPVPIHRISADSVNAALNKYMGISLDDLSGVGADELIYLKDYDAYYNFTSDAGGSSFVCTSGETQGDTVRLYGDNATLTLKKQGDGFVIVSYQQAGEGGASSLSAVTGTGYDVPDAVLDYAREYVGQQVDFYNEAGNNPPSGTGTYAITDAKITGLTQIDTHTIGTYSRINMYRLEYRLLPDKPDNVVLAGGMKMEEIGGQSWLTEWGSTGQPYLLLYQDSQTDEWRRVCVTNTDVITQDYGTPEMLERYGDAYTAAATELYEKYVGESAEFDAKAAVYDLFDAGGGMSVTLNLADKGAFGAYSVTDEWYAERYAVLLGSYEWTRLDMPGTAPSDFWINVSSADGSRYMTFWSGGAGTLQYFDGESTAYWLAVPKYDGSVSIAWDMRAEYDNLDVDYGRISFSSSGSAEDVVREFTQNAFASHMLGLDPGGIYGVTDYKVLDGCSVTEVSGNGSAILGCFRYAVVPVDNDSTALWAGNTVAGEGEYEGWLVMSREFVLQKQDDGYWHCTDLGTGGCSLPE